MTACLRHIPAAAVGFCLTSGALAAANPLETAVRACISQRGETVEWRAVLGDWDSVRLKRDPSKAMVWAMTLEELVALANDASPEKITDLSQKYFPDMERILKRDFRENFWDRFDHPTGWQLGIFYNPGGFTKCLAWHTDAKVDDFGFMRGEVTGDLLWDAFTGDIPAHQLWRAFGASLAAGPQANVAAIVLNGVVLQPEALADAPRSFFEVEVYHQVEDQ